MNERTIRRIAIAGGGIVGLSAAAAFARSLPQTQVTVLVTPPDPAALADRLPTSWPGVGRFHAAIGVEEAELVRAGIATHHLGTMFESWPGTWTHGFGFHGKPVGPVGFDQIWARAEAVGKVLSYDRYSIAAALAGAGKFVHPATDRVSLGSRFLYGLRLDPESYRDHLRMAAESSGVVIREGAIAGIDRAEGGGIAALDIGGGERIEADLFIDCTGPGAALIGAVDDSFEDWSKWLPFDRMVLESQASADIPGTADRAVANDDGWSAAWPLRGRTLTARLSVGGEGFALARGRRLRPWVHNVLALGDSATALDPLEGLNLDLAQQAILLALELLPGRAFNPLETAEYNRRAEQVTRRVLDYIALHYLRSGRTTGVWAELATREPPDSLMRTLDQYAHRGRLPFHEEETVTRDSWTAALLGLGVVPRNVDPQALNVPLDKALAAMDRLAREIDQTVTGLPAYGDYLARITR